MVVRVCQIRPFPPPLPSFPSDHASPPPCSFPIATFFLSINCRPLQSDLAVPTLREGGGKLPIDRIATRFLLVGPKVSNSQKTFNLSQTTAVNRDNEDLAHFPLQWTPRQTRVICSLSRLPSFPPQIEADYRTRRRRQTNES